MNEAILEKAFMYGREAYKKAISEAHKKLSDEYSDLNFDTLYEASEKGISLYIQAYELGAKIHGGMLSMEKAFSILQKQNPGFSEKTYEKALSGAFADTR